MNNLKLGQIYRYSSSNSPEIESIDGLPNLLFYTKTFGENKALLEAGINQVGAVNSVSGKRTPAILITSSTHKHGSKETPWQDIFDIDNGFIRYFGDTKSDMNPTLSTGNKRLLEQFEFHKSDVHELRLKAVPLLFFRSVKVGDRVKGNRIFQGLGLLRSAELVTQHQKNIGYFTNFVYEFDILDLKNEYQYFSWDWISARRDPSVSDEISLKLAPKAWQDWVLQGNGIRERVTRRVLKRTTVPKAEQLPLEGSREDRCLEDIFNHYAAKKHHFELLASKVVASILNNSGARYHEGWITQGSGDGGIDFVGRIDLGSGLAKVEVVVLGQAKCENYKTPTNGVHLARTVARLKRGWIGAYVTTSFFSEGSQREISEDRYPLITVSGLDLARETLKLVEESGARDVLDYLKTLDVEYPQVISLKKPEDVLSE
jgi:hypothetical protein